MSKFITPDKILCHLEKLNDWTNGKTINPITVELHPSNTCNHECEYCFADLQKDGAMLTLNDGLKIIRKLGKMGVSGLIFSGGGEPTLSPHLRDFILEARLKGMEVGIITNGVNIPRTLSYSIAKHATWIRFSVDSFKKNTYKKIRGVDTTVEVIKNIRQLVADKKSIGSKITIGTQTVVTKDSLPDLMQTAYLSRKLKVDYYQMRPLENVPYSEEEFTKMVKEVNIVMEVAETKTFSVIKSGKWDIVEPATAEDRGYSECWCYPMIGAISAHGKIYICCHFVGNPMFCYGNMITDSITDVLKKREEIKDNIKLKFCPPACRGNQINIRLEGLKRGSEHGAFL